MMVSTAPSAGVYIKIVEVEVVEWKWKWLSGSGSGWVEVEVVEQWKWKWFPPAQFYLVKSSRTFPAIIPAIIPASLRTIVCIIFLLCEHCGPMATVPIAILTV